MENKKKILLLVCAWIVISLLLARIFIIPSKWRFQVNPESKSNIIQIPTPLPAAQTLPSRFGKIPLHISSSKNIIFGSSVTILNSSTNYYPIRSPNPEHSRGKTITLEGVYYVYRDSPRIDWGWNGNKDVSSRICLIKRLDLPDDTIVQAEVQVSSTPQEYCETGEVNQYKVLYSPNSISNLAKKLAPLCQDIASFFIKENSKNPLKLYSCFGSDSPQAKFGEKFTNRDFEWLPFENKMLVSLWALSAETTRDLCNLERRGAIVLKASSQKIESVYLTRPDELCIMY